MTVRAQRDPEARERISYLRCPRCRGEIIPAGAGLGCQACAATYAIDDGVPVLLGAAVDVERRIAALDEEMARHHVAMALMSLATLRWLPAERVRMLRSLGLRAGERVLDHCTGPGGNLKTLASEIGSAGMLVAMDLSGRVVHQASALARRHGLDVHVHQADALALPYADRFFDAVVHYGALNQFGSEKGRAIDEILRVTRPGGLVVLLDEGLAEERRRGLWGRVIMARNSLFASRPPLDLLPAEVTPQVRWVIAGMFYEIRFRTPG